MFEHFISECDRQSRFSVNQNQETITYDTSHHKGLKSMPFRPSIQWTEDFPTNLFNKFCSICRFLEWQANFDKDGHFYGPKEFEIIFFFSNKK